MGRPLGLIDGDSDLGETSVQLGLVSMPAVPDSEKVTTVLNQNRWKIIATFVVIDILTDFRLAEFAELFVADADVCRVDEVNVVHHDLPPYRLIMVTTSSVKGSLTYIH